MELFQSGPNRYPASSNRSTNYANVNQSTLALTVGLVAVGLPIVLYFASHAAIFDTCFHHSISHFYYASFWGTLFTGALVFIGAYLVVYQGDDVQGAEDRLATYAGLAAFGIAFFQRGGGDAMT